MKMKKIAMFIALVMVLALAFSACAAPAPVASSEAPASSAPASSAPASSAPASSAPAAPENPNKADFTYVTDPGTIFDLNKYYKDVSVDCDVTILSKGGTVQVPDGMTTPMPKANKKYTIGFSVYYTVDEVGSMILDTMKKAAEDAGVTLLVNDANYKQDAQNQAIEQWILQKVDGVILAPCDFTGVKTALDALATAKIPVVTLNPPLAGTTYAVTTFDCVEQGQLAGELLEKALLDAKKEMKGVIVYQTLPFVHPNAATRALGFKNVFAKYPDIKIVELTGVSPEEHYTAFEGAIQKYPKMLGAWGLYSSATIGMLNAKKANKRNDILLTSVDNDKPILKGIFEGDIVGSSCYSSIWPAQWTMAQMINLLNGVDIPGVVYGANLKVTKENVEQAFAAYYPGKTLADYISGKVQ
jgi:ABC-type sugar transport system substrate-binding protein